MTDRPIIFSPPMVRALLEGRKTQTRRLATSPLRLCEPGDRLWAKERSTVQQVIRVSTLEGVQLTVCVDMDADGARTWVKVAEADAPKILRRVRERRDGARAMAPAILMPRVASRLTLIVDDVRIERLRSISGHDSRCEGVDRDGGDWKDYSGAEMPCLSARESYATLWDSLHTGEGERWQDNPEIVALTFRVERTNVDAVPL